MPFTKLHQIPIGFGHLRFHDFHRFIAYRDILNFIEVQSGWCFEGGT